MSIPKWITIAAGWIWRKIKGEESKKIGGDQQITQTGGQGNTTIINQINNINLYTIKEIASDSVGEIMKIHNIDQKQINFSKKLITNSGSHQELVYNLGVLTGSTAAATGIPMDTIKEELENKLAAAYSWRCPKCGTINIATPDRKCTQCDEHNAGR